MLNIANIILRNHFLSKIDHFTILEHKFSHKSDMKITFITNLRNMTYEHYLKQPKRMIEWKIVEKLAKN